MGKPRVGKNEKSNWEASLGHKCGDLIILLRPFFALFYFGFIFHAVDQNRGDLLRVKNVLLRSCALSCTNCCVSRCEQMLQIFRQFFFLTFSDSALPDVIMIACEATLNRQTCVVTHGDDI